MLRTYCRRSFNPSVGGHLFYGTSFSLDFQQSDGQRYARHMVARRREDEVESSGEYYSKEEGLVLEIGKNMLSERFLNR